LHFHLHHFENHQLQQKQIVLKFGEQKGSEPMSQIPNLLQRTIDLRGPAALAIETKEVQFRIH